MTEEEKQRRLALKEAEKRQLRERKEEEKRKKEEKKPAKSEQKKRQREEEDTEETKRHRAQKLTQKRRRGEDDQEEAKRQKAQTLTDEGTLALWEWEAENGIYQAVLVPDSDSESEDTAYRLCLVDTAMSV